MIDVLRYTFNAAHNMTQVGSNVLADDTIEYNIGNDLSVLAGINTYKTTSSSENIHAGVSGGNNAVAISGGYNKSSNRASGTSYDSSNIAADNTQSIKFLTMRQRRR
jgi:hypothetical protein